MPTKKNPPSQPNGTKKIAHKANRSALLLCEAGVNRTTMYGNTRT